MLDELAVKDFGIIESITWRPAGGLNVITGETGAGKSLVVDAVEALLSGQVHEEDIRHGSDEARVEGVFNTEHGRGEESLKRFLAEKGLEADEESVLISCQFRRRGRAAPRVNRQAVSRSILKSVGAALVDIHGQSQHLSLLNKDQHLNFLDAYAHTLDLRHIFGTKVSELHHIEREIQSLYRDEQELARHIDLLNFQIEEIQRAELQEGEEEELKKELTLLNSAEKLKAASYDVYRIIYGDESAPDSSSAVDRANEALPVLKQIVDADPSLRDKLGYLEEMVHSLEEIAREMRTYGENLDFDPQRLEEVQNRLELIRTLKRKYGDSIPEILEFCEKAAKELEGLTGSGERREQLEIQREALRKDMGTLAQELSEKRLEAAEKLAAAVEKELGELAMERVDFSVSIAQEPAEDGIPLPDGRCLRFGSSGTDDVVFMASTNPGEPTKPLDRIASTGEISRFLLALKTALADADTIPVLIFDEIDMGIGGRSGEIIGRKLWGLSRHHQVICVTHLPQIAAFADAHYRVSKQTAGDRTVSSITPLNGEERFNELAVMIGGPDYTENALKAARELIDGAEAWKSG